MSAMRKGIATERIGLPCAPEAKDRERAKAVEVRDGRDEARGALGVRALLRHAPGEDIGGCARFLCLLLSLCFLLYTDDLFALTARDVRPILHRWTGFSPGPQSVVSWKGRFGAVLSRLGAVVYHADGQLSTKQLTDFSAQVTDTYTFDAFGVTLGQTGTTPNHYQYTGEQLDPNLGFYYLRARYFDRRNGRFVSEDPLEGTPLDPASLHRYLYANANPIGRWDPSGMFSLVELLAATLIVAILLGVLLSALRGGGRRPGETFEDCLARLLSKALALPVLVVTAGSQIALGLAALLQNSIFNASFIAPGFVSPEILTQFPSAAQVGVVAVTFRILGVQRYLTVPGNILGQFLYHVGTTSFLQLASEILAIAITAIVGIIIGSLAGAAIRCLVFTEPPEEGGAPA